MKVKLILLQQERKIYRQHDIERKEKKQTVIMYMHDTTCRRNIDIEICRELFSLSIKILKVFLMNFFFRINCKS